MRTVWGRTSSAPPSAASFVRHCWWPRPRALAVAGRPFCKAGAQRNGAWTDACALAARTAGHGAVNSAISDRGNSDSDSGSDSGRENGSGGSDSSVDVHGSGDGDTSSTLKANTGESDDSDSGAGGGSEPRGRFRRSAASLAKAQPRVGTRS